MPRFGTWLFKSEPSTFSFDDLVASPDQTTPWDGVRNYQARNTLRDLVKVGDRVLFYHSQGSPAPKAARQPLAIVGTATVVRAGYPDSTAFDPGSPGHDPKSDPERPTWYRVDVKALARLAQPLTREMLAREPGLAEMELLRRGSRLSIQPVRPSEWAVVCRLAGLDPETGAPPTTPG